MNPDDKDTKGKEKTEKEGKENEEKEIISYAHIRGEWEERKISVFGAVRSFIGQLRTGQDLTRVSLPCVFLRPYSLLEEVAARNYSHIDLLFNSTKETDPLLRMLGICRWLVATASQEKFNHKPFNPVIGEVHRCKLNHDPKDETNTTYAIVEQIKHHPPVCGLRIDNPYYKVSIEGFYTFQVQFNKNSVTVANHGKTTICLGDEEYWMSKAMPDLLIKNVIIGTKQVCWEGTLGLDCKKTGYKGAFELTTKGNVNVVGGPVYYCKESEDIALATIEGKCGGPAVWFYNPRHPRFADLEEKSKKEKKAAKKELEKERQFVEEPEVYKCIVPKYPRSQEENSSIRTWEKVAKCIVENDMDKGDEEKVKIEERQRVFLKEKGEEWKPVYFEEDKEKGSWKVKDPNWWKSYKD